MERRRMSFSKLAKNPFFWFILFLAGLEILAAHFFVYKDVPAAGTVFRNPRLRRGWPEYLSAKGITRGLSVVLISNSQGPGKELADENQIYAARLERGLREAGFDCKVENWSLNGIRTVDVEMLSIKVLERRPDLVIFVMGYSSFDALPHVNLDYPDSDLNLLAGDPSLWKFFGDTLFVRHAKIEQFLNRMYFLHIPLLRWRFIVEDYLLFHLPPFLNLPLFGEEEFRYPVFDLRDLPSDYRHKRMRYITDPDRKVKVVETRSETEERLSTFKAFYPLLRKRLSRHGIPFLWVWGPAAVEVMEEDTVDNILWFDREAGRIVESSGARSLDFTQAIPARYFYHYTHLDETGHQMFCSLLLPEVMHELQ